MKQIKIFIAEDHTVVRQGLIALLNSYDNIEVIGDADNGQTAYDMVLKLSPDVVLMDIIMPEMNGIECTKKLLARNSSIKVLVLTCHEEIDIITEILKSGSKGYVLKTSPIDELISAIIAVNSGKTYYVSEIAEKVFQNYIKLTRVNPPLQKNDSIPELLTVREIEVLKLLSIGLSHKMIANDLGISIKTVETHRDHLLRKTKTDSTISLIKFANDHGLVPEQPSLKS